MSDSAPSFDSNDVMAYILGVCADNNIQWNITKAQKLMYCCYGMILAVFGEKLTEEAPQAWQYGPVFPRTYNAIRKGRIRPGDDQGFSRACPPKWLPVLREAVQSFGQFTASQLSTWSHRNGSPWYVASSGGTELGVQIPAKYISDYFSRFVKNDQATAS